MSKLKKKLKTQGKNSKLKVKTQKVGTFRIPGCRKSVQKKACLKVLLFVLHSMFHLAQEYLGTLVAAGVKAGFTCLAANISIKFSQLNRTLQ